MTCSSCGRENSGESRFCMSCGAPMPAAQTADGAPIPPPPPRPESLVNPYHGAQPKVGSSTGGQGPYAGFWVRFFASLIDGILFGVVIMILFIPVLLIAGMAGDQESIAWISNLFSYGVAMPLFWLYEAFMTSSAKQATVGKLALGLRVTDLNGDRLTFGRATGRHFAKYLSQFTLMVGYLIQPFTARKQALHDLVAGTLVE